MTRKGHFGKAEIITKDEFDRLCSFLSQSDKAKCLICWFTTERIGAVLQLPQNCIYDIRGNVREFLIIPSEIRKAAAGESAETREVFCHPALRNFLKSFPRSASDYLFPSPTDITKPFAYATFWRRFQAAVKSAGLGSRRITSHSFRRSAITYLSRTGLSDAELMAITGHKTTSSLHKYIEGDPLRQQKAILQLR